jgi:hypothetical protein
MPAALASEIVPSASREPWSPQQTRRAFLSLLECGVVLRTPGEARRSPEHLLARYAPRHEIRLFDTRFFLGDVRQNYYLRFFVAFVVQGRTAHARIFYKDGSLIWRAASHVGRLAGEFWVGKGAVTTVRDAGDEFTYSLESTTDLPIEVQPAIEELSRGASRIPTDEKALDLVLRRAPDGRIEPYRDFSEPRRRAWANPRNRIHGGRRVAWFTRKGDPSSLRFATGFEPDFAGGILERSTFTSRLYLGTVRRFRLLSRNRRIQYLFLAGPRHVWIIPPQALTRELSSYGVRTVDVAADEDLFVPGFEYHYLDESQDPPVLYSQIPEGYEGPGSATDDARADASRWLERLPIIQEFRRKVLGSRRSSAPSPSEARSPRWR